MFNFISSHRMARFDLSLVLDRTGDSRPDRRWDPRANVTMSFCNIHEFGTLYEWYLAHSMHIIILSPSPFAYGASESSCRGLETDWDGLIRTLSRWRINAREGQQETNAEIKQLFSSLFGHTRKKGFQEKNIRHLGVVFKNLTVEGRECSAD